MYGRPQENAGPSISLGTTAFGGIRMGAKNAAMSAVMDAAGGIQSK